MELTAENVSAILKECFFKEGEDYSNYIKGEGVMVLFGFHPERLKENTPAIENMLSQLPTDFKESGGSFLNACMTEDGRQWGEHVDVDELICLGNAIGKLKFLSDRKAWPMLPAGMPYFVIR